MPHVPRLRADHLVRAVPRLAPALLLAALPLAEAAEAQSLRPALRAAARDSTFGKDIAGLAGFAALPGVKASGYSIERDAPTRDTEVGRYAAPLSHRFDGVGVLGGDLYLEGTLGWFTLEQTYPTFFTGTRFQPAPDSRIDAVSATGGIGVAWDVAERLSLTPIFMLGYAHVEDDTSFIGPGAARLDRASRGILFNWDAQELLYGPALKVEYGQPLAGDVNFTATGRANWVLGTTLAASSRALEGDTSLVIGTLHGELDGPTTHSIAGRELRWILFSAATLLAGDASNALGVDWIAEFGIGAEIVDREVAAGFGLEGVSLRASLITGDGVAGWSLGGALEF